VRVLDAFSGISFFSAEFGPVRPDAKLARKAFWVFICLSFTALLSLGTQTESANPADEAALSDALCPIVYPVDETPSEQGYQYIFYGNAFFVNNEGYLVTAAHVLSAFRNGGGQPYILLSRPMAPRRLQKASLIAVDWEHDVAVLRATPNSFEGNYKVAYLPLTAQGLVAGNAVLALALRPAKVEDAHTFQAPLHDRLTGQVLDYQFTQEEKGAGDTELLLFDHDVLRGQSGAPVLSADTHEVVGIVDGRWLRPSVVHVATAKLPATLERSTASVGAAVRIHYAIALLQQNGIAWQPSSQTPAANEPEQNEEDDKGFSVPFPVSVVPAPYPPQSLFGGEVILDALVDSDGKLVDVKVVHGDPPFLDKAQSAVETWSFRPARFAGEPVDARVGVVFEFAEPYLPSPKPRGHTYREPPDSDDGAPLPVYTVEPEYPLNAVAEGSVVVLGIVDAQGQLTSTQVIRDVPPLTAATTAAMHQWRFASGKKAGENTESAVIVVAAFRRPALARVGSAKQSE
jgi:hypothetical protein